MSTFICLHTLEIGQLKEVASEARDPALVCPQDMYVHAYERLLHFMRRISVFQRHWLDQPWARGQRRRRQRQYGRPYT